MSSHLPSVLPDWWSDFEDSEQWLPLSPGVLLVIDALPHSVDRSIPHRGARRYADFSMWETSRARCIVAYEATRDLYGVGRFMERELARRNLVQFDGVKQSFAIEFSGYDPTKPQEMPSQIVKLVPPGFPDISSL